MTGCAQRIGVLAFGPEVTNCLIQVHRGETEVEAAAGSGNRGPQSSAAWSATDVVEPVALGPGHANAGRIGAVLATQRRIARVDRAARIVVIAADRGVNATRRRIARVRRASVMVVARRIRRKHATRRRIARVRCARVMVIARRVRREHAAGGGIARIGGASVVVVARRIGRIDAASRRITRVGGASVVIVAGGFGV